MVQCVGVPVRCGRCMPCRLAKRREWQVRCQLELLTQPLAAFVTLTFSDEHLPVDELGRGIVDRGTAQRWQARLRRLVAPQLLRFVTNAEYGDKTWRPHYHSLVFGLAPCVYGRFGGPRCACPTCAVLRASWLFGHVHVGEVTDQSVMYICGHTVKRMVKVDDPRLAGRPPEFVLRSRRPGIGADGLALIAQSILDRPGVMDALVARGEVPTSIRIGPKLVPLDRYSVVHLRELLGFTVYGWDGGVRLAQLQARLMDQRAAHPGVSERELFGSPARVASIEARARVFASVKRL